MTAKEYLSQLRLLDIKINQKIKEAEELKALAFNAGALSAEGERVQTSLSGSSRQCDMIEKYVDLQVEIDSEIDKYVDLKHKIINEIHQLSDPRYVELLNLRYVPDKEGRVKRLEDIAVVMKKSNGGEYSYQRIRELHGYALKAFGEKILKYYIKPT